ncbi:hypothetical protein FQA39_LY08204 [Lamprigera yunnana]|nr:hypothetical protein FQA39_LY08204 [Lamprigera yunnana]
MINEEKGNGSNNKSRNIHQYVASEKMIQGEEYYHDIGKQVDNRVDVQSESASNWRSEDPSDLDGDNETENESSDNSESGGAVDRIDNSNAAGNANNKGDYLYINLINGDDAISYVQLKREGKICTVKCKICPEHKVHAKLYGVTLTVDEDEEKVTSVQ